MRGEQGPGGTVATDLEPAESWAWPDLILAGVPVLEMEARVSAPRPSATCVSGEPEQVGFASILEHLIKCPGQITCPHESYFPSDWTSLSLSFII